MHGWAGMWESRCVWAFEIHPSVLDWVIIVHV